MLANSSSEFDLKSISRRFRIMGDFVAAHPHGSGHINDTFAALYSQGGQPVRYIHQRVNHTVFKDVPALMENVGRVTRFLESRLRDIGADDISRRTLTLVPADDGKDYLRDAEGNYWRTYIFIENARTYDVIASPAQAREAGRAFGNFLRLLADFPPPRLAETIPGFHNFRARFNQFVAAVDEDKLDRAASCAAEISFIREREDIVDIPAVLQAQGKLPERVTLNDTKLNNVLIDDTTGEGICVIDLDTVMPGLSLYDFGDMIRTAACSVEEDERDLAKVHLQLPMFEAVTRGFLEATADMLTAAEKDCLVLSCRLLTLEMGMRFLTDYLQGDVYYKIRRPAHNLDRCRVQLAMIKSLETHDAVLESFVRSLK